MLCQAGQGAAGYLVPPSVPKRCANIHNCAYMYSMIFGHAQAALDLGVQGGLVPNQAQHAEFC